jgi:6-phosphogluconolactonase
VLQGRFRLPENFADDLALQPFGVHAYKESTDFNYGKVPEDREDLWIKRRNYLVNCMRLVDALDRQNLWEKTVVILTADHGEMNCAHLMQQKGAVHYDEITLVNLTAVVPGGPQGQRTTAIGSHLDLAPTLLDFAGLGPDEMGSRFPHLKRRSLKDVILSPDQDGPHGRDELQGCLQPGPQTEDGGPFPARAMEGAMSGARPVGDTTAGALMPPAVVYVSNADSQEISVLQLNAADGRVSPIESVTVGGRVTPLAISPDRRFLYAGLRSVPYSVRVFAIDSACGTLIPMQTAPLADNMAYLSIDRRGRFLFGASYSGSRISVNAIGSNGEVDATPLAVIPTGKNAHAVATDRSNRFLFVTCLGDDEILEYRFDETNGAVTPNEPPAISTQEGAGPRHFAFHPTSPFMFCLNELDGTVNTYRLEDSGTLTPLASASVRPDDITGKPWAADIHLTPDGRFLYTSERTSSTLAAFSVDRDSGALMAVGHYTTERQPRSFAIDPGSAYLLAAGEKSNGLSVYAIDQQSGALRAVSRLSVGKDPNWVEIIDVPKEPVA